MNTEIVNVIALPNVSSSSGGNVNIYPASFPGLYRVSVYVEQVSGTFVLDVGLVWINLVPVLQAFDMGSLDTSTSTITFKPILIKAQSGISFNYTFTSGSGVCNIYAVVEKVS